MAIRREDLFPLTHYDYGEAFFGSYRGMRYRVARDPLKDVHFLSDTERADAKLSAKIWPEPYAYARTPKDQIATEFFDYTEKGMDALVDWMNAAYEARDGEWPS